MAKNTSILLGDYFGNFIKKQIESGKFSSTSEVIRAAFRILEQEETKKAELIKALKEGEMSDFVTDFNPETCLKELHDKQLSQ